jgi:hypothetical protein
MFCKQYFGFLKVENLVHGPFTNRMLMNPFTLESGQVFLCILYHPIALIGSVLGLKT